MISKIKKVISLSLCLAMAATLFTGCGAKKEQLPELLEPSVMTDWYYAPFEYDLGIPDIYLGKVYYETYDVSFDIPVNIESILVKHGDEVKKGDKLATVDVGDSQNQLDNVNTLIKNENTSFDYLTKDLEKIKTNTKKLIEQAKANGAEKKEIEELNAIIAVAEENYRYDKVNHEETIRKYETEASKYKVLVDNSVLYAPCDGVVSNVEWKGFTHFQPEQPIVTILNKNERYITNDKMDASMSGKYDSYIKKIIYKGEEYDANEIKYSDDIYQAAAVDPSTYRYPYKLTFDGIDELETGENVIIQLYPSLVHSEKTIMLDSVRENEGNAIYVKGETGTPEKRMVTFGEKDAHYIQVLDGLEDDDLVYCSTYTPVPVSTNASEVQMKDYDLINYTIGYWQMGMNTTYVDSEVQGIVTKMSENFVAGKTINVDDYIFSVSTGEGAVELKQAELTLKRAKKAYKDTESSYDAMIKEIKGDSQEEKDAKAELIEAKRRQLEKLQAEVDQATKNSEYIAAKYDEEGNLKVYSKNAGEIQRVKIKLNDRVENGQDIYEIKGHSVSDLLYVFPESVTQPKILYNDPDDPGDYGETVTIEAHGNVQEYTVVGGCFDPFRRKYENDFFIKGAEGVEPYSGGVVSYKSINLRKGVTIFTSSVLDEKQMGLNDTYVWVERNGYPVKQYIINQANSVCLVDSAGSEVVVLYGLKNGDKVY